MLMRPREQILADRKLRNSDVASGTTMNRKSGTQPRRDLIVTFALA